MRKNFLIIVIIAAVFTAAFPGKSQAQDFGRPIMAKIAQNTIFGGLGGAALMTVIWATDPLNPEFQLVDMALIGISVGIIGGFAWGIYTSSQTVRSYDQYRRKSDDEILYGPDSELGQDPSNKTGPQKDGQYNDFGNIFEDDRNYFDQLEDVNDNSIPLQQPPMIISPNITALSKKHDPTRYQADPLREKESGYRFIIAGYQYPL